MVALSTMAQLTKTYLDPLILASIGSLELVARTVVEGFVAGLHQSPYQGQSVEFTEHRPYFPGDEIRRIDWRAYAKSDKYLVKEYEEETNLKAYILLDTSSSMEYGDKKITKIEYGKYIAASLGYLMLRQRDGVGLVRFSDSIEDYIPPRASPNHLEAIISSLQKSKPEGKTNFTACCAELAERIKKRGLVIVISDLIDDPDSVIRSLKLLHAQKHEVIVFQIVHPDEIELPYRGYTRFEHPEIKSLLHTDPAKLRQDYKKAIEARLEYFRTQCINYHLDYMRMDTNKPLDYALSFYLQSR